MSRINIKSIEQQQTISQVFQLADVQLRANRQGGKYLLMKLSDRTGVITAMRWNAEDQDIEGLKKGGFVFCEGRAQLYNNAMQLIVTATRPVAASEVDLEDFERFDSETASANLDSIRDIFDSFRNVPLRRLGALFLEDEDFVDDLSHAAAAVSHHHAYPGGLLQHTLDMMNLGKMLSPRYPGVDGEVVQFGAFLHDLGKMEELSIGNNASYTTRGQLLGHIVIGIQRLQDRFSQYEKVHGEPFPETLGTHLEHLICSHHGLVEYGSPRIPQTLEAVLLHHIDLLDAKMASATAFIQSDQSGDPAWTAYSQNLQRRFWKPDQDPGMP